MCIGSKQLVNYNARSVKNTAIFTLVRLLPLHHLNDILFRGKRSKSTKMVEGTDPKQYRQYYAPSLEYTTLFT